MLTIGRFPCDRSRFVSIQARIHPGIIKPRKVTEIIRRRSRKIRELKSTICRWATCTSCAKVAIHANRRRLPSRGMTTRLWEVRRSGVNVVVKKSYFFLPFLVSCNVVMQRASRRRVKFVERVWKISSRKNQYDSRHYSILARNSDNEKHNSNKNRTSKPNYYQV